MRLIPGNYSCRVIDGKLKKYENKMMSTKQEYLIEDGVLL